MQRPPFWTAQKHGQDWTDPDVARASDWLKSYADAGTWNERTERAKAWYLDAAAGWRVGEDRPVFDPRDTIAWFLLQADTYASDRAFIEPGMASRIVGPLKRLGQHLDALRSIGGIDERAKDLLYPASPAENGLFELLVALAYKLHGWEAVDFVPRQRGKQKTHEFDATRGKTSWAVECKWMSLPEPVIEERRRVEALLAPFHAAMRAAGRSVKVDIEFLDEVANVEPAEIEAMTTAWVKRARREWETPRFKARLRVIDYRYANALFKAGDRVFFGASRMIEVLSSETYDHDSQYSFRARWKECPERPRFAIGVSQASIVRWRSLSEGSLRRQATHFKRVVFGSLPQFPGDRPGVLHVGYDATGGREAQERRDAQNRELMAAFDAREANLLWVYGNYLAPEATTQRNESAGTEETAAAYRVGRHTTQEPLPDVLLLSDDEPKLGGHWLYPQYSRF
ncbi:hypothetical protein [Brevundimonas sp. FT23042]|uniref:hypothetical protein n=1 Tax=Brevundimonas sp. FT23042 TaxID=3393749 RepID=UPI003B58AE6F